VRATIAALGGYCLVAFLFFGLPLLAEPGKQYLGEPNDPQIPIWSFAWWPHAILHGQNPFVTHAVWAPVGVNLAWVNTIPPIALLAAPLTWTIGAIGAYNVAAVLLPAVSSWTAFLLCRHVTRRLWPSLFGGYVFGFSSYMLGHLSGQPQLTGVFLLPLVALLVLRRVEGTLSPRAFVLWLGLVLGVQLYLALEVGFTLTVALACALVLAYLFVPDERRRLARSVPAIAAAYAVAAVVASPILYYALTDLRKTGFQPPEHFVADLANVVVPTRVEAAGAGWTRSIAAHFPANNTERGAYLGVALLVLLCLYVWQQRRRAGTRFLAAALLLALYASLGPHLTVAGHELIPLPTVFGHEALTLPGIGKTHLALFNNILPIRFTVYFALAAAVIAAIWTARAPAGAAMALGGLSVLLLVPNPVAWRTTYSIPAFFTNARYRPCIPVGANVLPQPIGSGGDAMLWQVERAFRFRMAGGRLQTSPPSPFHHPQATAQIGVGYLPVRNQPQLLRAYARRFGVSFAIVDERQARTWAPALDRIAQRHELGGVLLYPIGRSLPAGCPSA